MEVEEIKKEILFYVKKCKNITLLVFVEELMKEQSKDSLS